MRSHACGSDAWEAASGKLLKHQRCPNACWLRLHPALPPCGWCSLAALLAFARARPLQRTRLQPPSACLSAPHLLRAAAPAGPHALPFSLPPPSASASFNVTNSPSCYAETSNRHSRISHLEPTTSKTEARQTQKHTFQLTKVAPSDKYGAPQKWDDDCCTLPPTRPARATGCALPLATTCAPASSAATTPRAPTISRSPLLGPVLALLACLRARDEAPLPRQMAEQPCLLVGGIS